MSFKNTRTIKSPLYLATPEDVQSVSDLLKTSFPQGYEEYVTTLGHGEYCGYLRVLLPQDVLAEYREYQETWRDYFFWEESPEVLTKKEAEETIAIAYTIDNDVVAFHPRNSAEIFVLPRNDDYIYKIGSNFYEAVDWLCDSGKLIEKSKTRFFVPWSWIEQNGHNIPWTADGGIPDDF